MDSKKTDKIQVEEIERAQRFMEDFSTELSKEA